MVSVLLEYIDLYYIYIMLALALCLMFQVATAQNNAGIIAGRSLFIDWYTLIEKSPYKIFY